MYESGEFKRHDKGSELSNLQAYGVVEPPHYNLGNIKDLNIYLVCGKTDLLASPIDYLWLYEELLSNGNKVDMI